MAAETGTGQTLISRERAIERLQQADPPPASSLEEVMAFDTQRQIDEGNHCEPVSAYRAMLAESGFQDVECLWQDYWLAVFVALKPQ